MFKTHQVHLTCFYLMPRLFQLPLYLNELFDILGYSVISC